MTPFHASVHLLDRGSFFPTQAEERRVSRDEHEYQPYQHKRSLGSGSRRYRIGSRYDTTELEAGGKSRDTVRQERLYPYVVYIIIVFIPNIHTQIKMKSAGEISKLHI